MHHRSFNPLVIGLCLACVACPRETGAQNETSPAAPEPHWHTDAAAALAAARAEGKFVLMDFTGSDWCPPCKVLDAEVFSRDAFARLAAEKFVLLKLDFPRRTKLSPELQQQNHALAERYGINAFPTALVADADGNELGRTEGYQPGKPDAWLERISSLATRQD